MTVSVIFSCDCERCDSKFKGKFYFGWPFLFSFSVYTTYLTMEHNVQFPPSQYWYCVLSMMVLFISLECSILMIVAMTFDRFYSIIRPHKAASFNTVKRAKITIICIVIFSVIFNIPHWFISGNAEWECLPYGGAMGKLYGEIHYWLSFLVDFALPFVLLLGMNSVIIHKLRTRSPSNQITKEWR